MDVFRVNFNPNTSDFNKLISLLDKHGFSDNITQPHDRKRICDSFGNNRFVVMYADSEPIGLTTWRGEMQWAIVDYKWLLEKPEQTGTVRRSRLGQCAGADWDTFDAAKLMIFSETVAF